MSQIQALVSLDIQLQAYSQNDIIKKIPPDILSEIKSKDEHPFFQMYSVCHEGKSIPKIEGKGYKPITWYRKAIQSIKNVMKKGIKFFNGHNTTNDNQDKQELGQVIHSFEEEIEGKLHSVSIGYFPPDTRDIAKNMDICSQEAEWNLVEVAGELIADACEAVTGIALANSENSTPAFKDAKRLAFVQAFENIASSGKDDLSGNDNKGAIMDITTIPFSELMAELKRRHTPPSQAYSIEEIKKDKEFVEDFKEIETLKQTLKSKDDEIEGFKTKNSELNRSIQLQSAKGLLSDICKENKLTENITNFVNKRYDKNKDKIEDLTKEGLLKFVENQTEIYQEANNIPQKDTPPLPSGDDIPDTEKNPLLKDD